MPFQHGELGGLDYRERCELLRPYVHNLTTSRPWHTAATIAIRYATVRRQGNKGKDGLERQVITYPSVYHRLLPILAHAYVFILLGRNLVRTPILHYSPIPALY